MTYSKAQTLHRRYHRLTRLAMRLRNHTGESLPMPVLVRIDAKQRRVRCLAEAHGWDVWFPDRPRPLATVAA